MRKFNQTMNRVTITILLFSFFLNTFAQPKSISVLPEKNVRVTGKIIDKDNQEKWQEWTDYVIRHQGGKSLEFQSVGQYVS